MISTPAGELSWTWYQRVDHSHLNGRLDVAGIGAVRSARRSHLEVREWQRRRYYQLQGQAQG